MTRVSVALVLLLLAGAGSLGAQSAPLPPGVDLSRLAGICNSVYKRFEDDKPNSPFDFRYERQVYEAAGVRIEEIADVDDPAPSVKARVRAMWSHALSHPTNPLGCNQANFDVRRGNVLKYAVAMHNSDFLSLTAQIWGVELNHVDESDGRTLLDYVQKEIDRTRGSSLESLMRGYYTMLRRSGALHRHELVGR